MTEKARQYRRSHVRRLDTLSRNECTAPDCTKPLVARDGQTIVSKICHIEAASSKGPRFNPAMDDDDRRHINNLILLCDECHSIIDNKENEVKYPVQLLKDWKAEHEAKSSLALYHNESPLSLAISAISSADFGESNYDTDLDSEVFNIQNKIEYNSIIRNKPLIDDYKIFYGKIANLYDELEKQGSFRKEKLLRNVRRVYLKVKGKYINSNDQSAASIQKNADSIFEDVEEALMLSCDKHLHDDDISFGIAIIMVDAFMRCKILEEPPTV